MDFNPDMPAKHAETLRRCRQARIAVWEGSVRSGKTVTSILAWVDFVCNAPDGGDLIMAGRTIDTLRRNVIEPMITLFGSANIKPVYGSGRVQIFGRTADLVGVDNAGAESRIRGVTLAGAYVDELTVLAAGKGEPWWEMLITRMSVSGAKIFATTNPDSPNHWLLKNYLERACLTVTRESTVQIRQEYDDTGLHRYRFTLADNPTLSEEYIASLKASKAGMFYKRFIEGEWVVAEGAVYPMLDEQKHFVSADVWQPSQFRKVVVGVDFGTTNPTHAVVIGVDDVNQRLVVGGECRVQQTEGRGVTVADQVARIREWLPTVTDGVPVTLYVDPSAAPFLTEWRQQTRQTPQKANNDVLKGISDVATLLDYPQPKLVFVGGAAPILWEEMSGYVWDSNAAVKGVDKPVKVDDHAVDALRYGVRGVRRVYGFWLKTPPPSQPVIDRVFLT